MIEYGETMNYLDNVPEENAFILSNGNKVRNLDELYLTIKSSDDSIFYNNVINDRNDFSNWIRACIHHDILANKLASLHNKQDFLKVLGEEIELIRNPRLRETAEFFKSDMNTIKNTPPISSVVEPVSSSVPPVVPSPVVDSVSDPISNAALSSTAVPTADSVSLQATHVVSKSFIDEIFEFEQVLKQLVDDIEKEIFSWE